MNWYYLIIAVFCITPLVIWAFALDSMFRIRNVAVACVCIIGTGLFAAAATSCFLSYCNTII